MSLDSATLFCRGCGNDVGLSAEILARLVQHHRLAAAPASIADFLPLLASLRCSSCGARSPILRAYVESELFPFSADDLSRTCLSCDDVLPAIRVAAMPWENICRPCLETSVDAPPPSDPILAICKRCGRPMKLRCTKRVPPIRYFLGCSAFPSCTYTQAMPDPD